MAKIAVVHYSSTGNVFRLAAALAEGAEFTGADVRLRRVAELAPPEAVGSNPRWAKHSEFVQSEAGPALASLDDLRWADGIALGTPTRFGGPAAQLKQFLDTTGGLWFEGVLAEKVVTAFTSASTAHGGLESTILATLNLAYNWGALIMPTGYADSEIAAGGNPYGSSWVSRGNALPDEVALRAAFGQGRRLAEVCDRLAK